MGCVAERIRSPCDLAPRVVKEVLPHLAVYRRDPVDLMFGTAD